jgi:hypothetical protein
MKILKAYILMLALLSAGVIVLVSCSGGNATFNKVTVTPADTTVATGSTTQIQFTARETLDDNSMTLNMTNLVSWSTSSPGAITVDTTGLASIATSTVQGTFTITATDPVNRINNKPLSSSATLTIENPLSTLVTPTTPIMAAGTQFQFSALAKFNSDPTISQNLTSIATTTWVSDNTRATVAYGLVTAAPSATGFVNIISSYTFTNVSTKVTRTGSTEVTIIATPLQSPLLVTAPSYTIAAGGTQVQFTATGTCTGMCITLSTIDYTKAVTWSSSNTAIATIISGASGGLNDGLATSGTTTGSITITATDPITGIAGSATLNVQ